MARITLPNGCQHTAFNVTPKNWKTKSASTKAHWSITYRFIDPEYLDQYPNGFQVMVKNMNHTTNLSDRQAATADVLGKLEKVLRDGYNPITARFEQKVSAGSYIIAPTEPVCTALEAAAARLKVTKDSSDSIDLTIRRFREGAAATGLEREHIGTFGRRHILAVLDASEKKKGPWGAASFNKHRTNLSILWSELLEVEAVPANPVRDIKTRKGIKKIRETLTPEERSKINVFLFEHYPTFWRFLHIFFHSSARESEMMRLQGKHINLEKQEVKYLVLKGRQYTEKIQPIKDIAVPFWEMAMAECGPEDYVFAKGLQPGPVPIDAIQISKRWRAHVKGKKQSRSTGKNASTMPKLDIEVTADFYSLKHSNLDELSALMSMAEAAKAAGHTSTAMVEQHYATGQKKREFEQIRKAGNKFA